MVEVTIHVPILTKITGSNRIFARGSTLREIISCIDDSHPGFKAAALNPEGHLNNYMQVYVKYNEMDEMSVVHDIDKLINGVAQIRFLPIACGG